MIELGCYEFNMIRFSIHQIIICTYIHTIYLFIKNQRISLFVFPLNL